GRLRAGDRSGLHAFLALDAQPDQRTDLAADLDGLFQREVAQVSHLDLAVGVLVYGQGVDHPYRVALAQAFQLLDDLPVEVRVVEPENDQLDRSDGHDGLLSRAGRPALRFLATGATTTDDPHRRPIGRHHPTRMRPYVLRCTGPGRGSPRRRRRALGGRDHLRAGSSATATTSR